MESSEAQRLKKNLRAEAFSNALTRVFSQSINDQDFLIVLGKLWLELDDTASPTQAVSKAKSKPLRALGEAPEPKELLFWCAQTDGFGCTPQSLIHIANSALSRNWPIHEGPQYALTLAGTSWAQGMGLLLNEARPDDAPLWPLLCAATALDPKTLAAVTQQAGSLSEKHRDVRDAMLALACHTGHGPLLDLALACLPSVEPTDTTLDFCCEAIARGHAHSGARTLLGISSCPALDAPEMAKKLGTTLGSPRLDEQLLAALCKSSMRLPGAFKGTPWSDAIDAMASRGVRELGLDALLDMATKAATSASSLDSRYGYGHKPSTLWCDRREMSVSDLEKLEASCIKLALLPRSTSLKGESPLAYRLVCMLHEARGPAGDLIRAAIDTWARDGFGKEALAWRRSASGHTVSIGSAIASLPRQKDPKKNFEDKISVWLLALAAQGFDFEAKASPKSKSLGERLRSTASLRAFWPLVEAHIVGTATKTPSASRRSQAL